MSMSTDPKVFDKRLVARLIKGGAISEQDYAQHLATLPDVADKAAIIEAQDVEAKGHHPAEDD